MIHKCIWIIGNVQGVGFRYSTRKIAFQLGIKGFVQNLPDGSVYIEAEGTENCMQEFIDWCHVGPSRSNIQSVSVLSGEIKRFKDFNIKF